MIAGIVEAVVVITPMEVIKVKVFNDMYRERPRYRGMVHATRDILKRSGIVSTLITQKTFIMYYSFQEYKVYFTV